jgi:hypothetical protein
MAPTRAYRKSARPGSFADGTVKQLWIGNPVETTDTFGDKKPTLAAKTTIFSADCSINDI